MPRKRIPRDHAKARQLRDELSLPEALLWRLLKGSPQGVHFRSQHPVGDYVLDFYCAKACVAFEVDGIAHEMHQRIDQTLHDAGVDFRMFSRGDQIDLFSRRPGHFTRGAAEPRKRRPDRHHTSAGDFIAHAERQLLQRSHVVLGAMD